MQAVSALDALVQYLIEEVSMDGDAGTDVSRLDTIVADFYSPSGTNSTKVAARQTLDESFLNFVWNMLCDQDDINIGTIGPTRGGGRGAKGEEEEEEEEKPKGGAQKKKKPSINDLVTYTLETLPEEEVQLGKKALIAKYGENLRIMVHPDVSWAALTTSHVKIKAITAPVYTLIQLVAREKGTGATTVQIGTALGIDQKSAFHYVKSAVTCGALKKFRVIAGGCATNRLIHTRYLAISKEWKMHLLKEKIVDSDDEVRVGGSDNDNFGPSTSADVMTPISVDYLTSNQALIESRILRVVKMEPEMTLPSRALIGAIGIRNYERVDARRLRTLVGKLVESGRLERLSIAPPGKKGAAENYLRFVPSIKEVGKNEEDVDPLQDADEGDDEAARPHALWNLSVERQVFDLLAAADADGLCLSDFRAALGGFNSRITEMILSRYENLAPPAHLADFSIHSVTENAGREKRTRFFLLSGYLRRLKRDGFPAGNLGFENEEMIGDWSALETTGFYHDETDLIKWTGKNVKLNKPGAKPTAPKKNRATTAPKPRKPPTPKTPKVIKPKPVKVIATPVPIAEGTLEEKAAKEAEKEAAKEAKNAARSKKKSEAKAALDAEKLRLAEEKWVADGNTGPYVPVLTYYERRKVQAEERAAKGLPPLTKRAPSAGGRRSKSVLAAMALARAEGREYVFSEEEGGGGEGEGSQAGSEVPEEDTPKAKAKPNKKTPVSKLKKDAPEISTPSPLLPLVAPTTTSSTLINSNAKKSRTSDITRSAKSKGKGKEVEVPVVAGEEMDVEVEEEEPTPAAPSTRKSSARGSTSAATTASIKKANLSTPKVVEATSSSPTKTSTQKASVTKSTSTTEPLAEVSTATPLVSTKKRVRISEDLPTFSRPSASGSSPSKGQRNVPEREEAYLEVLVEPSPKRVQIEEPVKSPKVPIVASPIPAAIVVEEDEVVEEEEEEALVIDKVADRRSSSPFKPQTARSAKVKQSLSALGRQRDVMEYVEANDGIVTNENRLNRYIQDFLKKREEEKPKKNQKQVHLMDRNVLTSTFKDLEEGQALKLTTVSSSSSFYNRHDIYYLPTIALDSPQMTEFLNRLTQKEATIRSSTLDTGAGGVGEAIPLPATFDNFDTIRDYFLQDRTVLSAQYGVYFGRFARARVLHQFMIDFATSQGTENPVLIRQDGRSTIILAHNDILSELPLHVCLRIYPIPSVSPELDNYLAQPEHGFIPCKSLPTSIYRILSLEFAKRSTLSAIMQYLSDLYLVKALVQVSPGNFETPSTFRATTHWELQSVAPLYAFNFRETRPLIAVLPINTSKTVQEYWTQLKDNSIYRGEGDTVTLQHPDFPSQYNANISSSLGLIITREKRWFDQYYLRDSQIQMLANLVIEGKEFDDAGMEALARAMLAPVDVIRSKFLAIQADPDTAFADSRTKRGRTAKRKQKGNSKKRRKVEKKVVKKKEGAEEEEEEEEEGGKDQGDNEQEKAVAVAKPESVRKRLGKKAKDEILQREKDFTAIFERFKREVGVPTVPDQIIEFLSNKFCTTSRLDVNRLDNEFRLLLPASDDIIIDPKFHSMIPASLFAAVELNEYELPRRVTHRSIRSDSGNRRPLPAVITSDFRPDEFLVAPALPVPVLAKGQRLPRRFYTPEQDELLLDAAAIVKTRATYLGKVLAWAPVEVLFPGLTVAKLRSHFLQIVGSAEEQAYHQRLQDAWMLIWESKRGTPELPDPNSFSIRDFDIVPFIRVLRSHVDKQALRLAGPTIDIVPNLPPSVLTTLPSSLDEFYDLFETQAGVGNTDANSKFSLYWKPAVGNLGREHIITNTAFSSPYGVIESKGAMSVDQDLALTIAMLKMTVITPTPSYSPARVFSILEPFKPHLKDAAEVLLSKNIITTHKSEPSRRIPGRGMVVNDKFSSNFDSLLTKKSIEDAETKLEEIVEGHDDLWPLEASQGPVVALLYLASRDAVDLSIDLTALDKIRDPSDYETRKANDEHIECNVNVTYTGELKPRVNPIPSIWPPRGITSNEQVLEQSVSSFKSTLISDINTSIQNAGSFGITFAQLSNAIKPEHMSKNNFSTIVESLLNCKHPLAFWAGYSTPVIISSRFLSKWTAPILLPSVAPLPKVVTKKGKGKQKEIVADEQVEDEERFILPILWGDWNGKTVPEVLEQAVAWLKGILLATSGATASQIAQKGTSSHVISLVDTMILLEALEKSEYIERRAPEGWFDGGKEEGVANWEVAQWYLSDWLRV